MRKINTEVSLFMSVDLIAVGQWEPRSFSDPSMCLFDVSSKEKIKR